MKPVYSSSIFLIDLDHIWCLLVAFFDQKDFLTITIINVWIYIHSVVLVPSFNMQSKRRERKESAQTLLVG